MSWLSLLHTKKSAWDTSNFGCKCKKTAVKWLIFRKGSNNIKESVGKKSDTLDKGIKSREEIIIEEVKKQDEGNDIIRGHSQEC